MESLQIVWKWIQTKMDLKTKKKEEETDKEELWRERPAAVKTRSKTKSKFYQIQHVIMFPTRNAMKMIWKKVFFNDIIICREPPPISRVHCASLTVCFSETQYEMKKKPYLIYIYVDETQQGEYSHK